MRLVYYQNKFAGYRQSFGLINGDGLLASERHAADTGLS